MRLEEAETGLRRQRAEAPLHARALGTDPQEADQRPGEDAEPVLALPHVAIVDPLAKAAFQAIEGVGTGAEPVKVVDEEIKAPWGPVTARYTTAVTKITVHEPSTVSRATTIPVAVAAFVDQEITDWGIVFAALLIGIAPVMELFAVLQRRMMEGFAGGLKA